MRRKTFLYAFCIILIACNNKESLLELKNENKLTNTNMLVFESTDEYLSDAKESIALNAEELTTLENSKGFKSFGRKCHEIYSSIDPEKIKSLEEVKNFVADNKDYLQLIQDENGELILETVLFNNPNRYIINEDKMYQIKNTVYKIFEKGVARTNEENIGKLKAMDDDNFSTFNNDPDIMIVENPKPPTTKDAAYNCGTSDDDYESSGNDRTHMWINVYQDNVDDYYPGLNGEPDTYVIIGTLIRTHYLIRPYKRILGIWFWCSRTISADIKTATDYYDSGWQRTIGRITITNKYDSKIEGTIGDWVSHGYFVNSQIHFGGYDCWADTPSSPTVNLECNTVLF